MSTVTVPQEDIFVLGTPKHGTMQMQKSDKENTAPDTPGTPGTPPPAEETRQMPPTPCAPRIQQGIPSPDDAKYIQMNGRRVHWTDSLNLTPPQKEDLDIWELNEKRNVKFKRMCPKCNFKENGGNVFSVCKCNN